MSEATVDGPGPPDVSVGPEQSLYVDPTADLEFRWAETWPNFSVDAYLEMHLGPKHLPKEVVIPLTFVYVTIFLTGLVGNFSVCLVIAKKNSMQTATNYYLFSLAVSDLLLLIFGLPNDLRLFWQQYPWMLGEFMCRTRALISEMTNYASILTIVAFTVERYVAICHPLLSQTTSSLPRVVKVIAVNWTIAAIVATPYALLTSVHYTDIPPGSRNYIKESAFCMMPTDPDVNPYFKILLCFSSLIFFFLPMTMIVILYINIGVTLRRSALQSSECSSFRNNGSGEGKPSARKAIIRMLVAVVIAFFICWAPFHAQRLLFVFGASHEWPPWLRRLNEILFFAGCLYYFNATINPILYNVMSAKYRAAFREVLCERFPRMTLCRPFHTLWQKQRSRRWSTTSHSFTDNQHNGRRKSYSIADTSVLYEETDTISGGGGVGLCGERNSITTSATDVSEDSPERRPLANGGATRYNGVAQYQAIQQVSPSIGVRNSLQIPSPTTTKRVGSTCPPAGDTKVSVSLNTNFRSSNDNFRKNNSRIRVPLSPCDVAGSDENETSL